MLYGSYTSSEPLKDPSPLLLDREKAYDRVSHEWRETCLIKSGFPAQLLRLIMNILPTSYYQQPFIPEVQISIRRSPRRPSRPKSCSSSPPNLFSVNWCRRTRSKFKSHCYDLFAVVATEKSLRTTHDVLTMYERSSGALLNSNN